MTAKAKVLICEDSQFFRNVFRDYLTEAGYEVLIAEDGKRGLEVTYGERPDLILLDVMIPEMDGYQVCRTLKQNADYQHIPIIICTVRSRDADEQLGRDAGADAYLTKSGSPEALLAKIEELLSKKGI